MNPILRLPLLALGLAATIGGARAEPGDTWGVAQLGYADGGWMIGRVGVRFADGLARDPLRLSAALEACREVIPRVQVGLRLSGLHLRSGEAGAHARLLISRLEAVATWRPLAAGPYARLGTGPALHAYDVYVPALASGRITQGGWSLSAAAGAFWPVRERLELRIELEAAAEALAGGAEDDPWLTWTLGGSAGVAWR